MQGLFQAIVLRKKLFISGVQSSSLPPSPAAPPSPPTLPLHRAVLCVQHISAQWIFEMSGHLLCLCEVDLNFHTTRHILEPATCIIHPRMYTVPVHLTLSTFCKHMH